MRAGRKGCDYGKLVKKRLIDLGMTQAELAEMIGVGRPYICRILTGDRSGKKYKADIERILKISE